MDSAPEASRLVLLSQLTQAAAGSKVRFLGCVDVYDSETATLQLRDRFPTSATSGSAHVNVTNVLDALNVELTQVGAWINVVGYVRQSDDTERSHMASRIPAHSPASNVDAVIIWSAGAVKLDEYEAAVTALQTTAI